ncbi:MAG: hypothetical protein J5979_03805 [Lachnospiraceae bacterium]|nr:hypothetical protein [Lachnospiraceae bacterium]
MDIFNLFASGCSIVGLFVSLFVASKVNKLSRSNNNNSGELQSGDGTQNIAKDDSVIISSSENCIYYNYTGATINGETIILPVPRKKDSSIKDWNSKQTSSIIPINYDKFNYNIPDNICNMIVQGESNNICFITDFSNIELNIGWIGYAIKSMPFHDWESFVNEDYILEFSYVGIGNINKIWIEMTNKSSNKKIYQEALDVTSQEKKFQLSLGKYKTRPEDWKSVDEICFVFFPEECVGQKGVVFISNLVIKKN